MSGPAPEGDNHTGNTETPVGDGNFGNFNDPGSNGDRDGTSSFDFSIEGRETSFDEERTNYVEVEGRDRSKRASGGSGSDGKNSNLSDLGVPITDPSYYEERNFMREHQSSKTESITGTRNSEVSSSDFSLSHESASFSSRVDDPSIVSKSNENSGNSLRNGSTPKYEKNARNREVTKDLDAIQESFSDLGGKLGTIAGILGFGLFMASPVSWIGAIGVIIGTKGLAMKAASLGMTLSSSFINATEGNYEKAGERLIDSVEQSVDLTNKLKPTPRPDLIVIKKSTQKNIRLLP